MIKYIQFRPDVVITCRGIDRSFNAWVIEKHADHCEPEETPTGFTLHEIVTSTKYEKGVAIKEAKRTGRRWKLFSPSIAWALIEDDKQKAKA